MPYMPVSTVSGMKTVEMMVSIFITWFRRFDVNDRCASSSAGEPIVEHRRLVGEPHQVIVDVAEPVRHRLGDLGELAPRQPADDVALRQ